MVFPTCLHDEKAGWGLEAYSKILASIQVSIGRGWVGGCKLLEFLRNLYILYSTHSHYRFTYSAFQDISSAVFNFHVCGMITTCTNTGKLRVCCHTQMANVHLDWFVYIQIYIQGMLHVRTARGHMPLSGTTT